MNEIFFLSESTEEKDFLESFRNVIQEIKQNCILTIILLNQSSKCKLNHLTKSKSSNYFSKRV